jgi:Protein of unknown function (DUF3341)
MNVRTWILGRFDESHQLVEAAEKLRSKGYSVMDAFMPYPQHEVLEAVKPKPSIIPYLVFAGGLTGFFFGYGLQWFCGTWDWAINIGGRDIYSPTTYVPICFECVILFSVLTATFSVFILNKLPMPYHPFFTTETFQKASTDAFILAVEAEPAKTDAQDVITHEMKAASAYSVEKVVEELS